MNINRWTQFSGEILTINRSLQQDFSDPAARNHLINQVNALLERISELNSEEKKLIASDIFALKEICLEKGLSPLVEKIQGVIRHISSSQFTATASSAQVEIESPEPDREEQEIDRLAACFIRDDFKAAEDGILIRESIMHLTPCLGSGLRYLVFGVRSEILSSPLNHLN